jgi:hypothetical protein
MKQLMKQTDYTEIDDLFEQKLKISTEKETEEECVSSDEEDEPEWALNDDKVVEQPINPVV